MKANELMIGDWVLYAGQYRKIDAIAEGGFSVCVSNGRWASTMAISPIPITKEILEKNGLMFDGMQTWRLFDGSFFDIFVVPVQPDNERWDEFSTRIEVCTRKSDLLIEAVEQIYVHQLQQFLRFCGIEKEIVL